MIPPLTSLRFLFAFLVFLSHSAFIFRSYPPLDWPLNFIFTEGRAGVCFFFIFSGFILTKAYGNSLYTKTISWLSFISKRIVRIYPMHILTLLLYLPYFLYTISREETGLTGDFIRNLLLNVLLLQSFYPQMDVYFAFNAPSWSLSVTMAFYLVFPGLLYIAFRNKKMYLFILLCLLVLLIISMKFSDTGSNHYLYYINPAIRLLDFAFGIGLYILIKNIKFEGPVWGGTILEVCAFAMFIAFILFHDKIEELYRYSVYYWLPSATIISVVYFQKGYISKLLSTKWPVFLGNISLSFYLLHWVMLRYLSGINSRLSLTDNALVLFTFIFFITLLCSSLCYLYIEKPFIKRFRNAEISNIKGAPAQ